MAINPSSRVLRNVLFADAASCIATGALQLLFIRGLTELLNVPPSLLAGTGWFLLLYGALVGAFAARGVAPRALVALFIAGNLAWAAACGALLAGGWIAPSLFGTAWIAAQAVTVVALALLQWTALRQIAASDWPGPGGQTW